MLIKWILALLVGILLFGIAAILVLISGLFVYDKTTPSVPEMSMKPGSISTQEFGAKLQSPVYTQSNFTRQLSETVSGARFEKPCRDRSTLVKQFYELGAENVWVQREARPLQMYIQLPDNATVRQAIIDCVAAECASGEVASYHHFLVADGIIVVGLISAD